MRGGMCCIVAACELVGKALTRRVPSGSVRGCAVVNMGSVAAACRRMQVWPAASMAGPQQELLGSVNALSYRAVVTPGYASVAAAEFLLRQLTCRDTRTAGRFCTDTHQTPCCRCS